MLIQCQSCSTKYRLNLERMPQRKTFVRCKACGTPIYIDPQSDEPLPSAVVLSPQTVQALQGQADQGETAQAGEPGFPPATLMQGLVPGLVPGAGLAAGADLAAGSAAAAEADQVTVQCPECDSRYRVPAEPLRRQGIKLKCTRCGHVFAPPAQAPLGAVLPAAETGRGFEPPPWAAAEEADWHAPPGPAGTDMAGTDMAGTDMAGTDMAGPAIAGPDMAAHAAAGPDESTALDDAFGPAAEAPLDRAAATGGVPHRPALDPFPAPDAEEDPEQAYLHAVSLEGEEGAAPAGERLIAPDLKYKLFLDSQQFRSGGALEDELPPEEPLPAAPAPVRYRPLDAADEEAAAEDAAAPDAAGQDSAAPDSAAQNQGLDLEHEAADVFEAASTEAPPPLDLPSMEGELPPLEDLQLEDMPEEPLPAAPPPATVPPKPGAGRGAKAAKAARPEDLPPLPAIISERPRPAPPGKTVEVPGQWTRLTEPRRLLVLGLATAAVLAAGVVWAAWLFNLPPVARAFVVEAERSNLLTLQSNLDTRYVVNQPSGRRLFVVQGTLSNDYPARRRISWVRLRGTLYADRGQTRTLASAGAYPGNVLEQRQLETMPLKDVLAYGGYNNGRGNENYHLLPGAQVPYQLVFADVSDPVARTVVQVISYYRDGLAVFLESPLLAF